MVRPLALLAPLLLLAACLGGDTGRSGISATATPGLTPQATPASAFTPPRELPHLTLDDIFPPRDVSTLNLDPSRLRTIIATGDVIPARATDGAIRARGDDFLYPVRKTATITSDADLTVINLEAPLIEGCPPHNSGFTFCGRPGFVEALRAAGVDVATLENNHIGNYGFQGVAETKEHLSSAGIDYADRATLAVRNVRGLEFGFLAFNGVGEAIDRQQLRQQIRAARPQVDVLAVAFHWGAEYVSLPQPAPGIAEDLPTEIARLAVDAGADLVIGNHPHWVQAMEIYKGKLIVYAHGNFIFDQMWSYETRVGVIGRYTFYDAVLLRAEFTPVLIENYAQPRPLKGVERRAVLDGMREASLALRRQLAAEQ
ncbi:MAG: CapA family protein [Dehalococcoidia bacterium]